MMGSLLNMLKFMEIIMGLGEFLISSSNTTFIAVFVLHESIITQDSIIHIFTYPSSYIAICLLIFEMFIMQSFLF